eukprot:CAMPEP_0179405796 /NCGR_PEP_ID=MMETSP0799-20121207/500_1 /TAXON_ID=46947 /ORGANISM="Geminigera cryophila, Strain CCMP2564" /LENGTH=67 /DNA_ID=CAMNT_0021176713 /DNA_START=19 /DNA_END=222 /DNA_ORIENTATION=-
MFAILVKAHNLTKLDEYADGTTWAPCGDFASDPNQLLSDASGGPPPGCPGGGPLSPNSYHDWGGIFE